MRDAACVVSMETAAQQQDMEQQQAYTEQQAAHCPGGGIRHRNTQAPQFLEGIH